MPELFKDGTLAGKVAYVAGGSRGMNLGIAKRYAAHGANVVVVARTADQVAAAAREIEAQGGGARALGLVADVRDYELVHATLKQTAETFGGLDIVVAGQAGNFYAPALGM